MFLSKLNQVEKKCFFRLAQMAAEANGEVKYEESDYLECYKQEMSLGDEDLNGVAEISAEDIVKVFSISEDSHKRIVLFETIAFMNVDGTFDEEEKAFTYRFAKQIGFSDENVDQIEKLVEDYVKSLTNIAKAIF